MTGEQLKTAVVAMTARWKETATKLGQPSTPEAFREWIVATTGGAVKAEHARASEKYTQAILDQCEAAIIAMGQVDKADLSQQHDPAHAHRQTMLKIEDENDRANLLEAIHESFSDGHLTEETARELSREVKDFKIRN